MGPLSVLAEPRTLILHRHRHRQTVEHTAAIAQSSPTVSPQHPPNNATVDVNVEIEPRLLQRRSQTEHPTGPLLLLLLLLLLLGGWVGVLGLQEQQQTGSLFLFSLVLAGLPVSGLCC